MSPTFIQKRPRHSKAVLCTVDGSSFVGGDQYFYPYIESWIDGNRRESPDQLCRHVWLPVIFLWPLLLRTYVLVTSLPGPGIFHSTHDRLNLSSTRSCPGRGWAGQVPGLCHWTPDGSKFKRQPTLGGKWSRWMGWMSKKWAREKERGGVLITRRVPDFPANKTLVCLLRLGVVDLCLVTHPASAVLGIHFIADRMVPRCAQGPGGGKGGGRLLVGVQYWVYRRADLAFFTFLVVSLMVLSPCEAFSMNNQERKMYVHLVRATCPFSPGSLESFFFSFPNLRVNSSLLAHVCCMYEVGVLVLLKKGKIYCTTHKHNVRERETCRTPTAEVSDVSKGELAGRCVCVCVLPYGGGKRPGTVNCHCQLSKVKPGDEWMDGWDVLCKDPKQNVPVSGEYPSCRATCWGRPLLAPRVIYSARRDALYKALSKKRHPPGRVGCDTKCAYSKSGETNMNGVPRCYCSQPVLEALVSQSSLLCACCALLFLSFWTLKFQPATREKPA